VCGGVQHSQPSAVRRSGRPGPGLPPGEPSDHRLRAWAFTYPTCHRLLQRACGGHLRGRWHLERAWHRPGRSHHRPILPAARAGPGQARPRLPPPPRLTGLRGRSCRPPQNPAPPVGTGVSPGGAWPSPDPPCILERHARPDPPVTAAEAAAVGGAHRRPAAPQPCSAGTAECSPASKRFYEALPRPP
jgi:hypothetical protein